MDLRDAAMLGVRQAADQGDDIKAELALRQGVSRLRLGAEADSAAVTLAVAAAANLEAQANEALDGNDRSVRLVGRPEPAATGRAYSGLGGQLDGPVGLRPGTSSGHG